MLNQIVIMGRLTRDPELRYTQSKLPVCSFRIACERDFSKSKDSNEHDADFIDVVAWRSTAEFVSKYFAKGRVAVARGRLQMREWTDRDGNKRITAEIVADGVYFGDSKTKENNAPGTENGGVPNGNADLSAGSSEPAYGFVPDWDETDGELPF